MPGLFLRISQRGIFGIAGPDSVHQWGSIDLAIFYPLSVDSKHILDEDTAVLDREEQIPGVEWTPWLNSFISINASSLNRGTHALYGIRQSRTGWFCSRCSHPDGSKAAARYSLPRIDHAFCRLGNHRCSSGHDVMLQHGRAVVITRCCDMTDTWSPHLLFDNGPQNSFKVCGESGFPLHIHFMFHDEVSFQ